MSGNGQYHTIIALVEDKPGVLTRVASLFRRRGFNIASLAVGHSEQKGLSRMTFVVEGDEYTVDQATKQLDKLIDVVKVSDISEVDLVARELALIKVKTTLETRGQIIEIVQLFRAKTVDVGAQSLVIEATGEEEKINALLDLLEPFGIMELMRTGRVAMVRGKADGQVSDNFGISYLGNGKDVAEASEIGSY
ncbi:MAG: acetolactate synthase small subunit [Chloroflexi bacterium]|nr:acetolactate synthase small subunit [Chloroflexota bacterium]MDA1218937.1 acetolactate synthase small subunit [Chloroflexota bacterium]PKB57980.1 MAG: acetolactate synthase small subunit [SAR202 cluster bacterium Casp-Chloro-G3]